MKRIKGHCRLDMHSKGPFPEFHLEFCLFQQAHHRGLCRLVIGNQGWSLGVDLSAVVGVDL